MDRPSNLLVLLGCSLLGCFVATNGDDEIGETIGTETTTNETSDTAETTMTDTSTTDDATDDATETDDTTDDTTSGDACEGRGGGMGTDQVFDELFPQPDPISSCCDIFLQDCGNGQKCVPYGEAGGTWAGTKCVDVLGDGIPGDPCTFDGILGATDDCGAGSYCFEVQQVGLMSIGVCTALCGGDPLSPICDPGTSCLIANNDALALCVSDCDPLLQDCGQGLGCHFADDSFSCLTIASDVPVGEPCEASNDCSPGGVCTPGSLFPMCGGDFCCASYCDVFDPVCLNVGTECVAFYAMGQAPPGYESVGLCVLPG
jgi:hypothetical protein